MLEFVKSLREEWPVIRQAPRTFAIVLILFLGIGLAGIYRLFNANLSRKNDLIQTLQGQLDAEKKKVPPLVQSTASPPPVRSPQVDLAPRKNVGTRAHTHIFQRSQGPASPNIVGNGNTVTVNPSAPAPVRTLTKEQGDRLEALVKAMGPHEIAFRHTQGNEESQQFADQLQDIIVMRAGWKIRRPKFLIQLREHYGVWVFVQDANAPPDSANILLDALNAKGVALGAKGMEVSGLEPGTVDLMVGLVEKPASK